MEIIESKYTKRKFELFSQIQELAEDVGYDNLTIRLICKRLDISNGTFYHYFPEKNDIARMLFSYIDNHFEHVVESFTNDESENLKIFMISYAQFVVDCGVGASKSINQAPIVNANASYLNEQRNIFQVLLGIIHRGKENNQIKSDLSDIDLARMIMIVLRGYCSDWAKNNGNYNLVAYVEMFVNTFIMTIK